MKVSPSATAGTSIVPTQATTSPKFGLINLKEGFTWTDIFREITRISLQDRTPRVYKEEGERRM